MGPIFSWLTNFAQSATEGIDNLFVEGSDLEGQISSASLRIVLVSSIALIVLVIAASLTKDKWPKLKLPLFLSIALIMAGSTLFLGASTVYLNVKSDSGGPVHWHADFEIWACGNQLELKDPFEFLSNKVGTATLHEHNDKRIHLEGVVVDEQTDASLGKFMHVVDGAITSNAMVIPLNNESEGPTFEDEVDGDGPNDSAPALIEPFLLYTDDNRYARFLSGQQCGGEYSEVQVFVYKYDEDNKTYAQAKLTDPASYSIGREPNVPPGDCIIFEFGPPKDQTDKLCEQYGVRDIDRCEQFGVTEEQIAICEVRQLNYPAQDPNEDILEIQEEL